MKKWIVLSSFMILAMLAALITGQPATAAPLLQQTLTQLVTVPDRHTLAVSPPRLPNLASLGNLVQYTLTVTNNAASEAQVAHRSAVMPGKPPSPPTS